MGTSGRWRQWESSFFSRVMGFVLGFHSFELYWDCLFFLLNENQPIVDSRRHNKASYGELVSFTLFLFNSQSLTTFSRKPLMPPRFALDQTSSRLRPSSISNELACSHTHTRNVPHVAAGLLTDRREIRRAAHLSVCTYRNRFFSLSPSLTLPPGKKIAPNDRLYVRRSIFPRATAREPRCRPNFLADFRTEIYELLWCLAVWRIIFSRLVGFSVTELWAGAWYFLWTPQLKLGN